MISRSTILDVCRDEYESLHIYKALSRSPLIDRKLRGVLERAAEDEYRHYSFWKSIVGECRSRVSSLRIFFYRLLLYLFGVTVVLKFLESKEVDASSLYRSIADSTPELRDVVSMIAEDEERHEREFLSSIDEGRVRYIGSITLGISDALVELTGIYSGSLGAFENSIGAGLAGLLAGIAASISMGIASYSQAKHEGRLSPRISALYTSTAYIAVVLLLALPYFILSNILAAFIAMICIAVGVVAYISFYAAVLHGRNYARELVESVALILGVSLLLYIIGSWLGSALGVKLAG